MSALTLTLFRSMEKGLGVIAGVFAIAGGLALLGLTVITGVSVFFRYILRSPIFGVEDVTTMVLTIIVAASVAWAATQQGHVSVNIISIWAGRKVTRVTDLLARFVSASVLAFASYALFIKGSCGMTCGAMTSSVGIIHTPFYYILGLAMGFYALLVFTHLRIGLEVWQSDDPNEVMD